MFAASAVIDRIWLEHNVTQNGEKGMIVHAKIWMKGVLNHRMHIDAYFDSPAGCGVMDTNGRYRADNGVAASVMNINNEYDDGHFDDLKLFMPYSELHQDYDNPDMACHIFIHDETAGAVLAKSEFVKFSYSTGRKAPANASRANNNINDTAGGSVYTEVRNTVFGEETWYHNPDGSAMVVTRRKCLYCSGTGQCPICFGAQGRWANGMWYACQSCAGLNGLCRQCFGKQFTVLTTFVNALGTAIGYDEYGGMYIGGGGNVRDDGHGNKVETRRSKAGGPVDLIQYNVPDYTGEPEVMWCEKCKKWGSPHTHKTVR